MFKRKEETKTLEFTGPEVECVGVIDLDDAEELELPEKKPIWYRTGIWATVAAIGGIAAAALYEIYKSSKESPAPVVDFSQAPAQPIVPHAEIIDVEPIEVIAEEVCAPEEVLTELTELIEAQDSKVEDGDFVANSETKVFHKKGCQFGDRIGDEKKVFLKSRDAAVAEGYKPCGRCKP